MSGGAQERRPFRAVAATPAPGPVSGPGRDQQVPPATGSDRPLRRIQAGPVETIALAVLPAAAHRVAARMPAAEVVAFGGEAGHEVLREGAAVRARAFASIDEFLDRKAPRS